MIWIVSARFKDNALYYNYHYEILDQNKTDHAMLLKDQSMHMIRIFYVHTKFNLSSLENFEIYTQAQNSEISHVVAAAFSSAQSTDSLRRLYFFKIITFSLLSKVEFVRL